MRDNPDPQPQPPVQWSEADDRAMDALLTEYFRQTDGTPSANKLDLANRPAAGPRDFTAEILAKLDHARSSVAASNASRVYRPAANKKGSRVVFAVRLFAALAASVLALVAVRTWKENAGLPELAINNLQTDGIGDPASITSPPDHASSPVPGSVSQSGDVAATAVESAKPHSTNKPRREPIVLSMDNASPGGASGSGDSETSTVPGVGSSKGLPGGTIVSSQMASLQDFDRQFVAYWKSIGVTPAPAVDEITLANRIADRFGFRPGVSKDPRSSENPGSGGTGNRVVATGQVTQELASEELFSNELQSRLLAERLVKQLGSGLGLSDQRQEQLVSSASEVIRSGGRFDHWISKWVASEAIPTDSPGTPTSKAAAMGEWVSGRVIGADVGCARCHDSPIDSRFNQHDYWAVAALFAPAQIDSVFYELPDGRQKVASPGAPKRWLGLSRPADRQDAEVSANIASREEFAQSLIGNRQLARSLVNHLWSIGFGTPMVSAASSPIAPPRDDSIETALEMLSEKLISADFDMRVAARWIVQCEPMKRGIPVELQGDGWQLAGESQLVSASLAQRSFAAARSSWPSASVAQLLAMMESRSGKQPAKIGPQDSMLAQPLTTVPGLQPGKASSGSNGGKATGKPVDNQDYWWTQWLSDREGLRGGWMESIRDRDQQVRHAFYAVGYRSVSERQLEWGQSLLATASASSSDRNEEIAKIYWIIQNAR